MANNPHDLQFAILETLVLQNPFDGCILVRWRQLGLEDYAKGPVAHNLALGVLNLAGLAGDAILDFFADYFSHPQGIKRCRPV
jgi:hypothetical protein